MDGLRIIGMLPLPKIYSKYIPFTPLPSSFNLNNHIILNKATYRGSPVHEGNVQDFISTLVEKYIPSDLPQWQVIVIPIASNKASLNVETSDGESGNQVRPILQIASHLV